VQSVIETPDFISDTKAARVTDEERERMIVKIAGDPMAGVEIPGTGGARKFVLPVAARAKAAAIVSSPSMGEWIYRCFC